MKKHTTHSLLTGLALFFLTAGIGTPPARAYEHRDLLKNSTSQTALKESLLPAGKWVPYPAYADRAAWDSLTGPFRNAIIDAGERRLDYRWLTVPAMAYMEYRTTGNRNVMQRPYGENAAALKDLLLAELAEGKGRFVPQLVNGLWQTCEMTSWAYSAHLGVQQSHSPLPDFGEHIIDLGAGERAALVAWAYYFLHNEFDRITPQINGRLLHELQRRIVRPYREHGYWWTGLGIRPGSRVINNWNPWCNYNVLLTCLLTEQQPDSLAAEVWQTMRSTDEFINYVKGDGACEEGPSYWPHAAGKLYDYLDLLARATGGSVNLFENRLVKSMGEYMARTYVGDGWVVNFADASARGGGPAELIFSYGRDVKSPLMTGYAAYLRDRAGKGRRGQYNPASAGDISRCLRALLNRTELEAAEARLPQATYTWYPETEFCYMTSPQELFLACKGGHNNESHNHNDVGTFSLYANRVPLFVDAGVGTYTRQTFGKERYSIWTMQSDWHNLPRINGTPQRNGGRFRATGTRFDARRNTFSTNIATAYPPEAGARSWVRSYTLSGSRVTITDRFELADATTPNEINFLTWGETDTTHPGRVTLNADGQTATLSYDASQFAVARETMPLNDNKLRGVWGKELIRVTLRAKKPETRGRYVFVIDVKTPKGMKGEGE